MKSASRLCPADARVRVVSRNRARIDTPCQRASFNSTTDSFSWGHDPYTLACKARPSFDRCWTSLSVSLSLSSLSFANLSNIPASTLRFFIVVGSIPGACKFLERKFQPLSWKSVRRSKIDLGTRAAWECTGQCYPQRRRTEELSDLHFHQPRLNTVDKKQVQQLCGLLATLVRSRHDHTIKHLFTGHIFHLR